MRRSDFHYELPAQLIAQRPLSERSASRLLVLDGASGALADRSVRDLPTLLEAGDLLVFNDTRVVPARVHGVKPTGGRVELLLERCVSETTALVQLRASKPIRAGLEIATGGGPVQILERSGELWLVATPGPPLPFFERCGEVPLPPYIERRPETDDRDRYQSVFARVPGAVAAPTASLHFDAALIAALDARRIERASVTLHVGAGTFQPVRTEDLRDHVLHAERFEVAVAASEAIARTRRRGARVIAVGTTVARALESAAEQGGSGEASAGTVPPCAGETRLFVLPGFRFRVVDALLTNFHLPESTLLMMVAAFAGRERVLAAYEHAVRTGYRFFSYGDAMLVTPAAGARG